MFLLLDGSTGDVLLLDSTDSLLLEFVAGTPEIHEHFDFDQDGDGDYQVPASVGESFSISGLVHNHGDYTLVGVASITDQVNCVGTINAPIGVFTLDPDMTTIVSIAVMTNDVGAWSLTVLFESNDPVTPNLVVTFEGERLSFRYIGRRCPRRSPYRQAPFRSFDRHVEYRSFHRRIQ